VNHRLPPAYRSRAAVRPPDADPLRRDADLARLEALLWLAEEPVSLRKLATAAGYPDAATARAAIDRLRGLLDAGGSSFQIEELAGGFQLLTRPEYYPWLVRLRRAAPDSQLGPALLETLAVIAYRQPVMRADIEAVRGVHCGEAVRQLMERKLVQIVGRHDSLGRPVLYGTTRRFLQSFGLKDLTELPPVDG
jgi:segregation and condensation protein B